MRSNYCKGLVVFMVVVALLSVPCTGVFAQSLEQDSDVIAGKMTGDALVVRPLSLAATVVGGGVFIVSLPFSALGRNIGSAFDYLLADPFMYTFVRPLGEF